MKSYKSQKTLGGYEEINYFCRPKTQISYSQYGKSSKKHLIFLLRRFQANDLGTYALANHSH